MHCTPTCRASTARRSLKHHPLRRMSSILLPSSRKTPMRTTRSHKSFHDLAPNQPPNHRRDPRPSYPRYFLLTMRRDLYRQLLCSETRDLTISVDIVGQSMKSSFEEGQLTAMVHRNFRQYSCTIGKLLFTLARPSLSLKHWFAGMPKSWQISRV